MTMRPMLHLAATLLLAGAALPAAAQTTPAAPQLRRAETHHVGRFAGKDVPYTAIVEDHAVTGIDGKPGASIVTIAYLREGVTDPAKRPVLFSFNGGPGAASAPLNTKALGPMIRAESVKPGPQAFLGSETGANAFVNNDRSLLDAVDLVFIDPVGTGVSRAWPGVDATQWYTGESDAASVQQAIRDWLRLHHREASPRYVIGESYGTSRAGALMKIRDALSFDGVLLVALVGRTDGPDLPFIASLPTMAAGWWHWNPATRGGRTVEQAYQAAVEFARTDYAMALIRGSSLPLADRQRIAQRMSAMIGVPPALILERDLRVAKNDWMFTVLKGKGLRTGLLDVRVTGPLAPGQDGAIDDPALNVMPTNRKPGERPLTPAEIGPVPNPAFGAYLTQTLEFPATEPYIAINFSANAAWKQDWKLNTIRYVAEAMAADPKLRLFWSAGYYDLTTPAYEARYTLDQAGIPADRLTAVTLAGPHGVYEGPENLAAFNDAVRKFVTAPKR